MFPPKPVSLPDPIIILPDWGVKVSEILLRVKVRCLEAEPKGSLLSPHAFCGSQPHLFFFFELQLFMPLYVVNYAQLSYSVYSLSTRFSESSQV